MAKERSIIDSLGRFTPSKNAVNGMLIRCKQICNDVAKNGLHVYTFYFRFTAPQKCGVTVASSIIHSVLYKAVYTFTAKMVKATQKFKKCFTVQYRTLKQKIFFCGVLTEFVFRCKLLYQVKPRNYGNNL